MTALVPSEILAVLDPGVEGKVRIALRCSTRTKRAPRLFIIDLEGEVAFVAKVHDKQNSLLGKESQVLKELHAILPRDVASTVEEPVRFAEVGPVAVLLKKAMKGAVLRIAAHRLPSAKVTKKAELAVDWLAAFHKKSGGTPEGIGWIHGDFTISNLLFHGNRLSVVDWEFAANYKNQAIDLFSFIFDLGGKIFDYSPQLPEKLLLSSPMQEIVRRLAVRYAERRGISLECVIAGARQHANYSLLLAERAGFQEIARFYAGYAARVGEVETRFRNVVNAGGR